MNQITETNRTSAVTFKRKAAWEGIRLEHYRLPAGELPEHRHREHVVIHNNLGVMLARQARLTEAEREFEIALRQTGGSFDDASHNLKLCRSLLTALAKAQIAALKTSRPIEAALK